jgi:hypothetical protein
MLISKRDDFRVFEELTSTGKHAWRIRVGGSKGTIVYSNKSFEEATEMARQLNLDPWYAERGNTSKDRAARYPTQKIT